ncbi:MULTISPECIES: MAPEG family protein [Shewanella]|uniref:MAPEG family protein n=1 Tax=Shewanella japonica TaxID=93973 RepID=A0ABN4YGV7_9GAMM|nr:MULTISPECIES: MAPEG family protein [Shewanella]ARD23631.1 hypothetical protein SJ2017_3380 [Shewanella japonica]KPZ69768.1 MAPEG family protein [Shewanella sp. P1-14-1]
MPLLEQFKNKLSSKQSDVSLSVVIGVIVSFLVVAYGALANPLEYTEPQSLVERLTIYAYGLILPALAFIFAAGRVLLRRFNTTQTHIRSAFEESEKTRHLQNVLQNTLEQFCIVLSVYFLWTFIMPAEFMSLIALLSIVFFIGRIIFISGYEKGSATRALGFSLTFYPSVLSVGAIIIYLFYRTFS